MNNGFSSLQSGFRTDIWRATVYPEKLGQGSLASLISILFPQPPQWWEGGILPPEPFQFQPEFYSGKSSSQSQSHNWHLHAIDGRREDWDDRTTNPWPGVQRGELKKG